MEPQLGQGSKCESNGETYRCGMIKGGGMGVSGRGTRVVLEVGATNGILSRVA